MSGPTEANEVKEVPEAKRKSGEVAAFFDLDGTLMPQPSMERRFFRLLGYREEIGLGNYGMWLREAVRLIPRGIRVMQHANKMYLRGVRSFDGRGGNVGDDRPVHDNRQPAEGQGVVSVARDPRMPMITLFTQGVEQAAWHAKEGHTIVLVSGTLEPLAEEAARALEDELAARGSATRIRVCATRLEEKDGKWTGKILGEAMFGKAKVRAVGRLAREMQLDLGKCVAYGDSAVDQWLLSVVGHAFAVNPSSGLARIARKYRWPVLDWEEKHKLTQRRTERRAITEKKKERAAIAGWSW